VPVRSLLTVLAIPIATLLAAFFAFVGYHKAFAPVAELAQHRVWTLALPEWAGRLVGWSELLLRLRLWAAGAALLLIVNQAAAAAVHWSSGEGDALPQNAVLVVLLGLVGLVAWLQHKPMGETS
jgi:peptidoglycan/LPS O-acetylase OafA/YrhL